MSARTRSQSRTAVAPPTTTDREPRTASSSPVRGDYSVKFSNEGDWTALRSARLWLQARGFSSGPHQRAGMIAVMHGDVEVPKWGDIDPDEKDNLHGMLIANAGDFRKGPITLLIRKYGPENVIAAFRSDPETAVSPSDSASATTDLHPEDLRAMAHIEGHSPGTLSQQLMCDP